MSQFQIFSQDEIATLRKGGKILRECLALVGNAVREGITTKELDTMAEDFIRSHEGAVPAFQGYQGFPASLCASVNDECVHGIPGDRVLKAGDIIALDGGVLFGGLNTDACLSVAVGEIPPEVRTFLNVSEQSLKNAVRKVRSGIRVGDISSEIQKTVEGGGYHCVKGLTGHGLGTHLHQFPDISNTGKAGVGAVIPAYTLIAIEPITAMGAAEIREKGDGWTICTADGSLSGHFEHTILVLPDGNEIIA
jgi:methionyl aminopeptidase